jgi:hypothetical protein
MGFPPDPVEITTKPSKPLPRYKSHGERIRTIAAVVNCLAAITNMTVALIILFVHYHI